MNEDILSAYQKHLDLSVIPDHEKHNESDLLKYSHHKRYSGYLAYLHTISSCSNEISCQILEQKLIDYSSTIDNRRGINNFASVAKSLANNVTNVSKKWTSGLENLPKDFTLKKFLKCNDSNNCENPSPEGCTAGIPSQHQVDKFFQTISKLKKDNQINPAQPSDFISSEQKYVEKKKTSLYSTYEDSYVNQMKCDNNSKIQNKLCQQKLNFKPPNYDGIEPKFKATKDVLSGFDNCSGKRLNQPETTNFKRYNPPNAYNKNNKYSDENESSKRICSAERIKKLSKYLNENEEDEVKQMNVFKTASEALKIQSQVKQNANHGNQYGGYSYGAGVKKSLGGKGRGASNRFVPPLRSSQEEESDMLITRSVLGRPGPGSSKNINQPGNSQPEDERLSHIDPKMIELIRSEIMDHGATITWDDIAGLDFAKHTIQEIVVWPMLRPDIFTGLRQPPKGMLLFGPPGTGKTLIGKCIASQSKSTFFSISASSLTSKWIGDGEKMVRALFAVARVEQPSVVFIDEIDSLLSQRSDQEHESSRRIKTEFLVQLDGAATGEEERILIIGATNRPQELDEAARRRLVKRLYIPLPDLMARKMLVSNLMSKERNDLTETDIDEIGKLTDGYSGADMKNLCQEASLGPIRTLSASLIAHINPDQVRPVNIEDFKQALKRVRSSVSSKDLDLYVEWDKQFGMSS